MTPRIQVPREAIERFCKNWQIMELDLFGSVLREDFGPESDVDVLVAFAPGVRWNFDQLLEMRRELEAMFGRRVDLVEKQLIERSENYIRRKHILSHLGCIYVAR